MNKLDVDNPVKPLYLPVMIGGPLTTIRKYPNPQDLIDKYDNYTKTYKFWDRESDAFYHHPCMLMSAFYNKGDNLKERYGLDRTKTFIFADSGGFQLSTGKANPDKWTPKAALDWAEDNATYTAILDFPARSVDKSFEWALEFSTKSAKYAAENRRGVKDGCRIVNVLSGHKLDLMDQWYEGIKDYEFEGWAHGGSHGDLVSYTEAILLLMNKGVYSPDMKAPMVHHIFGVTHTSAMMYVSYLQRLLNEMSIPVRLSYDSSSASMAIGMGKWFREVTLNGSIMKHMKGGKMRENEVTLNGVSSWSIAKANNDLKANFKRMKRYGLGCDCPVCSQITNLDDMVRDECYTDHLYLLGWLHNMYLQLRFKMHMDSMVNLGNEALFDASLPANIHNSFKVLKKAFHNPQAGIHTLELELNKLGHRRKRLDEAVNMTSFFGGK